LAEFASCGGAGEQLTVFSSISPGYYVQSPHESPMLENCDEERFWQNLMKELEAPKEIWTEPRRIWWMVWPIYARK
jgi:hypothetical protein